MRRLTIILVLAAILCGGCGSKVLMTIRIPGTSAQISMKLIPSGTFTMGSPDAEVGRHDYEGPQHLVTITKPFYMGVYEVTQEIWEAVMGTNPSGFDDNPANPVETVSWNDCQAFIAELNNKGIGTFRLPTEAEWEYACRAGSTTRFSWGDDPSYTEIGEYAWYGTNSSSKTHPVGEKVPNGWGLYDMQGNVWEWCSDRFGTYDDITVIDPSGPTTGSFFVMRGGGWGDNRETLRSANRSNYQPTSSNNGIGFRLVRTSP